MSIFLDETAVHCTGELTRKHIAEAFWNSEVESELRLHGDITFKFKERLDREKFMDAVDQKRASHPYPHTQCSEECRKRGILLLL